MAGGQQSGTIQFWDMSSGEMLFTLCGHYSGVNILKKINNQYLASGGKDSKIIIWDLLRANLSLIFNRHSNEILAIEYLTENLIVN